MLILLDPTHYDDWLHCPVNRAPTFFNAYPSEMLLALPAARPPRTDVARGATNDR